MLKKYIHFRLVGDNDLSTGVYNSTGFNSGSLGTRRDFKHLTFSLISLAFSSCASMVQNAPERDHLRIVSSYQQGSGQVIHRPCGKLSADPCTGSPDVRNKNIDQCNQKVGSWAVWFSLSKKTNGFFSPDEKKLDIYRRPVYFQRRDI